MRPFEEQRPCAILRILTGLFARPPNIQGFLIFNFNRERKDPSSRRGQMQVCPAHRGYLHHHVVSSEVRERLQQTLLHLHHCGSPFRFGGPALALGRTL